MSNSQIICVANQKGGAGKTTITILLALILQRAGKSVAIIDMDYGQQTASKTIENLKERIDTKIDVIDKPTDGYDIILIDTKPELNDTLKQTLKISDVILLVTSPSPAELWSTQDTTEFIKKHRRNGCVTRVLFNRIIKKAKISRNLKSLAEQVGFLPLNNMLSQHVAYQYAILLGLKALGKDEREELYLVAIEIAGLH